MVTEQSWYEGGYRANVVAYAIAKLAHDAKELKKTVDFDTIWRSQAMSDAMEQTLVLVAKEAHKVLVNPPTGSRNDQQSKSSVYSMGLRPRSLYSMPVVDSGLK